MSLGQVSSTSVNCRVAGTKVTFYRKREAELLPYFESEANFVYCKDVAGLMNHMGLPKYDANDWRLFLDSSKASLKAVLLHNGNDHASVPIGHSVELNEEYDDVSFALTKMKYDEHRWPICVDLKMVSILLGQQAGYTKHPCFLCNWDSRADSLHWTTKTWGERKLIVGKQNVIREPLVTVDRIVLPFLHIKLGLVKQFLKALNKEGECFKYIVNKLSTVSIMKLKAGVLNGPQIRRLVNDANFVESMTELEAGAWRSFVAVCKNFLGNHRSEDYVEQVETMLLSFEKLGCRMSIKVHYLSFRLVPGEPRRHE